MTATPDESAAPRRTIVITGAASGIGRATALLCNNRGDRVAALDVDQAGLSALAADSGAQLLTIVCDVSDDRAMSHALGLVTAELGAPTGVVAAAGIEINAPLHAIACETWERVLAVNLRGVFLTCKYAIGAMLDAGHGGSIVCVSSPAAFVGFAGGGNSAYAASKGAVSALIRSAAIDYAPHGIRINALVPGATDTPLLATAPGPRDREALLGQAATQIPLGRLGEPSEIARAAAWLLSDESSYVTGSQLICDGGLLAKSANTI
jgi:NAD(P)-dependent dehydrogenase (short-subunit alcohol dehydrogenase family)